MSQLTKIESLLTDLSKAIKRLDEASLLSAKNPINRDATIQRFEFTFELSWKLMQAILQDQGINTSIGVKNIIRESARSINLIDNPQAWFRFLDCRNKIAHTYNDLLAEQVYKEAITFIPLVKTLIKNVKNFLS